MSYDMLNSTQNIPCISYGATANRKGGVPELEFEKPVFIVDSFFTWAGSERWIEEDGMAASLASLREVLGFGFLDV